MKYLAFIWSEGLSTAEELAVMRREIPPYNEEMIRRGVFLFGRELKLPETAATVRVRDGETLVSDGPFAETKEFVAGFELLDCADLEEAVEVTAKSPVAWFKTMEIRPFPGEPSLSPEASAFGRGEDGGVTPYLLAVWTGGQAVTEEDEAWRQDLRARGLQVLGGALGGAAAATTIRVRDGQALLDRGPCTGPEKFIASMDVVRCAERQQAITIAASHPAAQDHVIEVRPFYKDDRA
jgi:hypothetical protein